MSDVLMNLGAIVSTLAILWLAMRSQEHKL